MRDFPGPGGSPDAATQALMRDLERMGAMTTDVDNDPYDGDDSDPRCTHCNGEIWVECDDPIQCCDDRCDGEMHPDPACGGTGLYEHQVIF